MKLLGLSIQGLRSFVGDHVFHFPQGSGTYFVTGDNLKHPEISPNGCGKSAIWDVLCWVLFGKSTRGQIAGDVANWGREYAAIGALDFEIRGVSYSITRTWDPNSLTLQVENAEPKVVAESVVVELIGLTYELFLATLVMSQFGKPFLELGKAKKLEWFSTVLGLDVWTEKSEAAKADAKTAKAERAACDTEIVEYAAKLETLAESLTSEQARSDAWVETNARSLESARSSVLRAGQSHDAAHAALAKLRARRVDDLDELRDAQQAQDAATRRLNNVSDCMEQLDTDVAGLRHESILLRRSIEVLAAVDGDCPTCRQVVSDAKLSEVERLLESQIVELGRRIDPLVADWERHSAAHCRDSAAHTERDAGLTARRRALQVLDREVSTAERRESGALRDLEDAEGRVDTTSRATSPHDVALGELDRTIATARTDCASATADRDACEADRVTADTLCNYFKDTRLWVCESAMGEFAAVMSSALEQLGLVGWDVRCDLEKPNKSGKSTSRGFQVLIKSPDAPDWVPWESWCGGETQRLLLSGSAAFSDLVCSRMGVNISAEVWDEPTQHLSPQGVEDLLGYLHARARRLGRQIFLVDHRSIEAGQFAGTYTVVLDQQGSRIESDQTRRNERCDQVLNRGTIRRRFSELQVSATS